MVIVSTISANNLRNLNLVHRIYVFVLSMLLRIIRIIVFFSVTVGRCSAGCRNRILCITYMAFRFPKDKIVSRSDCKTKSQDKD